MIITISADEEVEDIVEEVRRVYCLRNCIRGEGRERKMEREEVVENEWFGGKKDEKGRGGRRINMRTAISSHKGMESIHFLLPSESENEDQRSGFPTDDLTHLLSL